MKQTLCAMLALVILLSLPGCTPTSYADTNGEEDFSLQTLTERDLIQGTNTSKMMSSTVTMGDKTTCKAQTLSGVEVLYEKRLKGETLDLVVSCQITKGNARLVLVLDDEIIHDFTLNKDSQHFTMENVTGKVYLKLAGESAGYTVSFVLQ